jgi:hypothetical protein
MAQVLQFVLVFCPEDLKETSFGKDDGLGRQYKKEFLTQRHKTLPIVRGAWVTMQESIICGGSTAWDQAKSQWIPYTAYSQRNEGHGKVWEMTWQWQ